MERGIKRLSPDMQQVPDKCWLLSLPTQAGLSFFPYLLQPLFQLAVPSLPTLSQAFLNPALLQ